VAAVWRHAAADGRVIAAAWVHNRRIQIVAGSSFEASPYFIPADLVLRLIFD
jgi:hypothetical protein